MNIKNIEQRQSSCLAAGIEMTVNTAVGASPRQTEHKVQWCAPILWNSEMILGCRSQRLHKLRNMQCTYINFYHKNTLFFSKCIQYLKTYYMVEPLHLMVINKKETEIYRLHNNQNHIQMESQTTVCPSK